MDNLKSFGEKFLKMMASLVLVAAMLPSAAFASDEDGAAGADDACSHFVSISTSPKQVSVGGEVEIVVTVDDPAAVGGCMVFYKNPYGGVGYLGLKGTQDGTFVGTIQITQSNFPKGEYSISEVYLRNEKGSWKVVDANLDYGDYKADLSSGSFCVVDDTIETAVFQFESVSVSSSSFFVGDEAIVSVGCSDDSANLCLLTYDSPSGIETFDSSTNIGGFLVVKRILKTGDVGNWTLKSVELWDEAGNYSCTRRGGSKTAHQESSADLSSGDFVVKPAEAATDLSNSEVSFSKMLWPYTGFSICPEPEVKFNGAVLTRGVDYELSYENNVEPGEATAIIKGIGRFCGSKTANFSIRRSVSIPESKSFAYLGREICAYSDDEHILVLPDGDSAATNAGQYEAYIELVDPSREMWEDGTVDEKIIGWEITPVDFSEVNVSGIESSYKYSGSTIEPNFECSYEGVALVEGIDYEVSYSDNTEPGVATVLIVGKGNFKGNRELHFDIEGREVNSAIKSNRENLIETVTEASGSSSEEPSVSYGNLSQNNYRYTFSCGDDEFRASYTVKDSGWTKVIGIRYDYRTDLVSVNFQQVKSGNYYAANASFFAADYRTSSDISFKDASGSGSMSISYAEKFSSVAIPKINSCMVEHLGSSLCKIGFTSYLHSHKGGNATCVKKAECDVCGQEYGDFGEHKGGNATCTEEARCDVCGQKYGSCAPHSIETVGAKSSSFEEEGYTGDQICSACGYVEHSGETIPRKTKPETDTVKGLVANGIIDKGSYDENGNPFIGSTTRSDGTVCTSRILFNGDTGLFELWCGVYDDSSAATLAISPFSSSAAAATVYLSVALRGAGSFDAVASITPASYRDGMSLYFNIVSQDIVGSNIDNERVQGLCNAYLQTAFPGWDLALLDKFGLYANMADLGFSSYEQPGYGIRDISNASVALYSKVYTYNGAPHCPAASVQYDGCELVDGVDYEVEYLNNTEIGFATARVRGKGFYKGLTDEIFSIAPYGTWQSDNGRWWYQHYDGSYIANGWEQIDGSWYHFDADGWMQTGWILDGSWYYLDGSGAMVTGWKSVGGAWYWFDDSGAMATGWRVVDGSWYYLDGSGSMRTGWLNAGGSWYYLSGSGAMATGWQLIGGTWYWFDDSGSMATGWRVIDGDYYYFDGSGAMQSSRWIGDYYLTSSGAMAKDQWIGSYHVGRDGRWDAIA